jgi:hypothetical protein
MHKVNSGSLLRIMQEFSVLGQLLMDALAMPNALAWDRTLNFQVKKLENIKEKAKSLREIAKNIELSALASSADRFVSYLDNPEPPFNIIGDNARLLEQQIRFLQNMANLLTVGIQDSFAGEEFLMVAASKRGYFKQSSPVFGDIAADKFAEAAEDIEEACKCFALDRYTATVFHLQRAMEAVVQKLGANLNVTIVDKDDKHLSWGIIAGNMKTHVDAMPKGALKDRWSEALSLLYHVKQAWHNPTMHPKKTYTEPQAKDVLDATGSFIRYLATLV